jgi:hypothetical protein
MAQMRTGWSFNRASAWPPAPSVQSTYTCAALCVHVCTRTTQAACEDEQHARSGTTDWYLQFCLLECFQYLVQQYRCVRCLSMGAELRNRSGLGVRRARCAQETLAIQTAKYTSLGQVHVLSNSDGTIPLECSCCLVGALQQRRRLSGNAMQCTQSA